VFCVFVLTTASKLDELSLGFVRGLGREGLAGSSRTGTVSADGTRDGSDLRMRVARHVNILSAAVRCGYISC
jgi:hypothetical protein